MLTLSPVYYYRASRIRSDGDIELGMEKCRSAILNVVRAEIHCDQELGVCTSMANKDSNFILI